MLELDSRRLPSRVRGRQTLERRIRALIIAVGRFSRLRTLTAGDAHWAARAIDELRELLPGTETGDSAEKRTT